MSLQVAVSAAERNGDDRWSRFCIAEEGVLYAGRARGRNAVHEEVRNAYPSSPVFSSGPDRRWCGDAPFSGPPSGSSLGVPPYRAASAARRRAGANRPLAATARRAFGTASGPSTLGACGSPRSDAAPPRSNRPPPRAGSRPGPLCPRSFSSACPARAGSTAP